ncbi:MAG: glycosyltransferase [Nitrospirae bacterium]|nr:glycosyltransferase [Nitrospirota bacterium]
MSANNLIFDRNLEVMKKYDPALATSVIEACVSDDLKLHTSKSGKLSLKVGDITLHSLYDPEKEAGKWVEYQREKVEMGSAVVVLGFGLGYHVAGLCELDICNISGMEIIVYEPRLDILKTALEHFDLTHVLTRVKLLTGDKIPLLPKCFTIVEHSPSVMVSESCLKNLHKKLRLRQTVKSGLKIMVVGPIYGGSLPVAGYCVSALKKLGHQVDYVDNSKYNEVFQSIPGITGEKAHQNQLRSMFISFLSEAAIARCAEFKPDLVFALAQAPLTEGSLQKLKENRIPTAFWFVEDFRFMNYWERIAPLYDYFFTIQRDQFFDKLDASGVRNYSYLPMAASQEVHRRLYLTKEEIDTYGSDISFVGAGYHNRRFFFSGLLDFDLKIWGSEWDVGLPLLRHIQRGGEWIDTEETVKIFNASKININIHSSTYHEGVNPHGDFVNPRTFEIAACGSFQLVDCRSNLLELFNMDEEIICFKDLTDARRKINYYLENHEEMAAIAQRGMERVIKEHTYEHRMEKMFEFILERGYERPSWDSRKEDVEGLIAEADRHTELGRYLERFRNKGAITISDIVDDMASGVGELSRVDKIFVLINEIGKQFAAKKD